MSAVTTATLQQQLFEAEARKLADALGKACEGVAACFAGYLPVGDTTPAAQEQMQALVREIADVIAAGVNTYDYGRLAFKAPAAGLFYYRFANAEKTPALLRAAIAGKAAADFVKKVEALGESLEEVRGLVNP